MGDYIVITRPQNNAQDFANSLGNVPTLYAPVLDIKDFPIGNIPNNTHIIATSPQVKQRVKAHYTIGEEAADVQSLLNIITEKHSKDIPLLYLRGQDISFDLKSALQDKGFTIDERIVYAAEPVKSLPADFISKLENGKIKAVTFFSKRSAEIFEGLFLDRKQQSLFASIDALCLSPEIVNSLHLLPWKSKAASKEKTAQSLSALVHECEGA